MAASTRLIPLGAARSAITAVALAALAAYGGPGDSAMRGPGTFESGYASINGLQMYYEIHGTGTTPLVLIHGGGSTIESSFGKILPLLAEHRKVIAVELQAHGRTSDRAGESSFEQDADDVSGLIGYLKVAKADICGFSNGGNAAMQIAIRHPEVVNKLVVISSFYKRDGLVPGLLDNMQNASLDNMPGPLKDAFLRVTPDTSRLRVMFDKDKARMLRFQDWPDQDLRAIRASTLFIAGDQDVVRPEHTVEMFRLVPQARLVILPGTHGSFIGEASAPAGDQRMPRLTVELIEEFLNH